MTYRIRILNAQESPYFITNEIFHASKEELEDMFQEYQSQVQEGVPGTKFFTEDKMELNLMFYISEFLRPKSMGYPINSN